MNVPVLIDEFCFDMTNVYEWIVFWFIRKKEEQAHTYSDILLLIGVLRATGRFVPGETKGYGQGQWVSV